MTLARGNIRGYEDDRMVLLFSMMDGAREVPCAVSASAMDELEHVPRTPAFKREEQFARPHRGVRVPQVPGAGVRRHASRHHRARHRFPFLTTLPLSRREGHDEPICGPLKNSSAPSPIMF